VVDFRADIYAVGGLLYFMLSGGHSPIEGSNVQNVWQRKLTEDPSPLHHYRSDLPDDLEALIMQCLARDAARRPASADDLKKLLLAALEEARTISSSLAGLRSALHHLRSCPTPAMAACGGRPSRWSQPQPW